MTRIVKRVFAAFAALAAALLFCVPVTVPDVRAEDGTGSLTLWCCKDDDVLSGMHWKIYRVGHRTANDYVFEGGFANYRATLGDRSKPMLEWDSETVAAAGETLRIKAIVANIPYRADGYTDSAGRLTFSGLDDGLYLVCGDNLEKDDTTYVPGAIFFEMKGEKEASLSAYPKMIVKKPKPEGVRYSVRKVWKHDKEKDLGVPITVEIYRDLELYKEVVLDESNNWTYSWEDYEDRDWFVYELEFLGKYSVAYQNSETQFVIINTFDNLLIANPIEGTPIDPKTTTAVDPSPSDATNTTTSPDIDAGSDKVANTTIVSANVNASSDERVTTSARGNGDPGGGSGGDPGDSSDGDKKLPQTGQLWWPVVPLACGGLLLIGAGIILSKKEEDE